MPPVGFFASAVGAYSSANGTEIFLTPAAARPNDVLLALIAAPTSSPMVAPSGWALLASDASGAPVSFTTYLFRRTVCDTEPAQHSFGVGTALNPQPIGELLLYRSVDQAAPIIAHGLALVSPTATAFPAPSIVLTHYSDLTLLAFYAASSGTPTFTLPAGTTQLGPTMYAASGNGCLVVAQYLKEAVGGTGTLSATCSTTETGLAAAYGVQAYPTQLAPSILPDVAGAIGLPTIGV